MVGPAVLGEPGSGIPCFGPETGKKCKNPWPSALVGRRLSRYYKGLCILRTFSGTGNPGRDNREAGRRWQGTDDAGGSVGRLLQAARLHLCQCRPKATRFGSLIVTGRLACERSNVAMGYPSVRRRPLGRGRGSRRGDRGRAARAAASWMFAQGEPAKVFVAMRPVDFRNGIDGLALAM